MSQNNELVLKPINDLLSESFYIPAYQRGYRWTQRQVIELLEDIREFQRQSEDSKKDAFYCLQPVVVKKRNGEWELVDGQQRLTTIHIILGCLNELMIALGKERYQLHYETRPDSATFLNEIDEDRYMDNIDFYYMYKAKEAVIDWFASKDGNYKIKFLQTLLNDDDTGKNVKVIWYQINEEIDVTAVFTRLNLGKIPLTNAELVKALYLKGSNFNESERNLAQLKIAHEWDEIERSLQSNDFWYFLSNKEVESNRIEFVLGLVAEEMEIEGKRIPKRDEYYVFLMFNKWISENESSIEEKWEHVKRCFMTLREWYEDRVFFHIIGFLISRGMDISELFSYFKKSHTKHEFSSELKSLLFKKSFPGLKSLSSYQEQIELRNAIEENLEQHSYKSSSNQQLVSILLLFNIGTLLANSKSNARFQFDRFKNDFWDIEHIRSVASEMPSSKERQKIWLEGVVDYIDGTLSNIKLTEEIHTLLKDIQDDSRDILAGATFDSDAFGNIFSRVLSVYAPDSDDEVDNSIGNLTLLDSSTNRSYQNAIFPIKRNRIIALDKTATFVPVCTKNVFLKYYSQQVDNMIFWSARDSENHQSAMGKIISDLFL